MKRGRQGAFQLARKRLAKSTAYALVAVALTTQLGCAGLGYAVMSLVPETPRAPPQTKAPAYLITLIDLNGEPISGARVRLFGQRLKAVAPGCFKQELKPGPPWNFEVEAPGFYPVEWERYEGPSGYNHLVHVMVPTTEPPRWTGDELYAPMTREAFAAAHCDERDFASARWLIRMAREHLCNAPGRCKTGRYPFVHQ